MNDIKSTKPLTIYESLKMDTLIKPQQIIHFLQKTPKDHIYTRPAKGGGTWDYVTGTYVKKSLNYAFGFMWSSEVKGIKEKYNQVIATVRLTIHNPQNGDVLMWKEDIGKKDIAFKKGTQTPMDYGNDEKAAITDGLKRCAAQFGIASDVYGKEEFKEIKLEKVVTSGTPEEISEEKERIRLTKYIAECKTVEELAQCLSSCADHPALQELYDEKYRTIGV